MVMKFTAVHSRMARAALGLGVRELAEMAKVSPDTIARLERGEELKERTLEAVQQVLEDAGVEFTNGGQPGVRMKAPQFFKDPEIHSSSDLSVRIRTFDGEFPVVIAIERSAIDDYFHLTSSTKEFRRSIVTLNFEAIISIAADRHRRRMWTEGQSAGSRFRQIVLREADLQGSKLQLPEL